MSVKCDKCGRRVKTWVRGLGEDMMITPCDCISNNEKITKVLNKWKTIAKNNQEMGDPEGQNIGAIIEELIEDIEETRKNGNQ